MGRALVREAARFATDRGVGWVELKTFSPNQRAMTFLEALGFRPRVIQLTSSTASILRHMEEEGGPQEGPDEAG